MDALTETLLTALALSQEDYQGPLTRAFPPRLRNALRTAKRRGWIETNGGVYLSEPGTAQLDEAYGSKPFG